MDGLLRGGRPVLAFLSATWWLRHNIPNAWMASPPGHEFWRVRLLLCPQLSANMNVHPPRRRRFCALRWHRQTASVVPCHRRRRHPRAASVRAADAASGHVALLNNPAAGHNPEVVSVPPLRAVLLGAHDAGVPARHHRGGLLQRGHRARHRCHPPAATRPWLATFRAACCCMLGPFNVHTLRSHSLAPLEAPIPVL